MPASPEKVMPGNVMIAVCTCGGVEFTAIGAPIASTICYCDDCQSGARQLEALPGAVVVQDADGGTRLIVFRQDRVICSRGEHFLTSCKLDAASTTNRVVASCCNAAMVMSFTDSRHWVSMYRARFHGDVPPLQMRICTRFRPEGEEIPDDVPAYPSYPLSFMAKLLGARIAMLLRR